MDTFLDAFSVAPRLKPENIEFICRVVGPGKTLMTGRRIGHKLPLFNGAPFAKGIHEAQFEAWIACNTRFLILEEVQGHCVPARVVRYRVRNFDVEEALVDGAHVGLSVETVVFRTLTWIGY